MLDRSSTSRPSHNRLTVMLHEALPPHADEMRDVLGPEAVAAFSPTTGAVCAVARLLGAELMAEARAQAAALETASAGFPFGQNSPALNRVSLAPRLLRAAGQLLQTARPTDVRLVESVAAPAASAALAGAAFVDQLDYHLCVPSRERCEAVVAIVHLADPASPTAFLGGDGAEHAVEGCGAGSVLFFPLGTPVRAAAETQRLTFRTAAAEWITADDPIRSGPVRHVSFTSVLGLCALGFPAPGNDHWTAASLGEAESRYPEHDLAPFGVCLQEANSDGSAPPPPVIVAPPPADSLGTAWQAPEFPAGTRGQVLSDEQVRVFREEGCLLLEGLWPAGLVAEAAAQAGDGLLSGRAADGVTQAQPEHNPVTSYPFDMPAINQLILHQRILGAVSQLVRQPASKLRLCGSSLSGKFGPDEPSAGKAFEFSWANKEGNQPMHQDYGNNTLLTPVRSASHWEEELNEVQCIIYYDDWEVGGPTAWVPGLRHTKAGASKAQTERLYAAECCAQYTPGTVLLYQLGVWHRGTPVNHGHVRRKQHLTFRTQDATWIGASVGVGSPTAKSLNALSDAARGFDLGQYLGGLTPDQRCVIGFPAVDSAYWTRETLDGVRERYGDAIDLAPYARAVRAPRL